MTTKDFGPIVSSSHLVSEHSPELSEFEFGVTIANNAFQRWIVRGMAAVGYPDLSPNDAERGTSATLTDVGASDKKSCAC